jgi:hypothetical protein
VKNITLLVNQGRELNYTSLSLEDLEPGLKPRDEVTQSHIGSHTRSSALIPDNYRNDGLINWLAFLKTVFGH